ncbi:MAG: ABC transporter ATP-binding protein [Pseudomonadota bacterium]
MSISLSRLMKSFGSHLAVDEVSLEIASGEFFVVLGPSGCGKTTLLRLIAGLEPLDGGDIVLADRPVAGDGLHLPPEERQVGFVFQSYALWPHMSVVDNVAFPLETAGESRRDARAAVADILRMVELDAYAERKPAALSGGQRQRVALARCLAQQAGTILMDEPLANLDPHLRAAMEDELARFHRQTGATSVYITHDQREAMALADRLAVMWEGRILQVEAPETVYRRPANERVAGFIGRSAIVDGEVLSSDSGRAQVSTGALTFEAACPLDTKPGPARIVVRPEDLSLSDAPEAVPARVSHSVYRGGFWETGLSVEGIGQHLVMALAMQPTTNEALRVSIDDAWVLPSTAC